MQAWAFTRSSSLMESSSSYRPSSTPFLNALSSPNPRNLLNLARAPGLSVEELLKRTFAEFATQRALGARDLPALLEQQSAQLAELERRCEAERCKPGSCAAIEEFCK